MGVLTQVLSGCTLCGLNDGCNIGSFPNKVPHGKHLINSEVDSMIKTLHGGDLFTRGESSEENLIPQNFGIK